MGARRRPLKGATAMNWGTHLFELFLITQAHTTYVAWVPSPLVYCPVRPVVPGLQTKCDRKGATAMGWATHLSGLFPIPQRRRLSFSVLCAQRLVVCKRGAGEGGAEMMGS